MPGSRYPGSTDGKPPIWALINLYWYLCFQLLYHAGLFESWLTWLGFLTVRALRWELSSKSKCWTKCKIHCTCKSDNSCHRSLMIHSINNFLSPGQYTLLFIFRSSPIELKASSNNITFCLAFSALETVHFKIFRKI